MGSFWNFPNRKIDKFPEFQNLKNPKNEQILELVAHSIFRTIRNVASSHICPLI